MNPDVETFMDDLRQSDAEKHAIVQALRQLVRSTHSDIEERIKYGGVMFSLAADCGGLFVTKHHVSFEFSHGKTMTDPDKVLEGSGKFRRHIKVQNLHDIEAKTVGYFVDQMVDQ